LSESSPPITQGDLCDNRKETSALEKMSALRRQQNVLTSYVVSDVHLNDHPFDRSQEAENPRRKHFRHFLGRINDDLEKREGDRVLIVLNGDNLDMTGSWFEEIPPWDPDVSRVESLTLAVLRRIIENNEPTFQELGRLVASGAGELVFVVGNHDGLIKRFPRTRKIIREAITPDPMLQKFIRFVSALDYPELGLYTEHGHQFDRFNCSHDVNVHPLGDYVNIMIVNRFVDLVMSKMRDNGYSTELISNVRLRLHDIEYLRPVSLIPLWIENIAKEYRRHPENDGKKETVDAIILWVMAEVLDTQATRSLVERLNLPRKFLTSIVNWFIHIPGTMPVVSFAISQAVRQSHSNRYQYRMAQRLHQEKGYQLIAFGHTHIPTVMPVSQDGYYFNTGSWKPVVNLFQEQAFPEANLEYLTPNVHFNKIERSGILVIQKSLEDLSLPPEFALHTNQSSQADGKVDSIFGF
jgi:UDP-2,3-diacylglucosamine pyrophosphatase LpxH